SLSASPQSPPTSSCVSPSPLPPPSSFSSSSMCSRKPSLPLMLWVEVDVSFNHEVVIHNTRLLRAYATCFGPRIQALFRLVKHWAKQRQVWQVKHRKAEEVPCGGDRAHPFRDTGHEVCGLGVLATDSRWQRLQRLVGLALFVLHPIPPPIHGRRFAFSVCVCVVLIRRELFGTLSLVAVSLVVFCVLLPFSRGGKGRTETAKEVDQIVCFLINCLCPLSDAYRGLLSNYSWLLLAIFFLQRTLQEELSSSSSSSSPPSASSCSSSSSSPSFPVSPSLPFTLHGSWLMLPLLHNAAHDFRFLPILPNLQKPPRCARFLQRCLTAGNLPFSAAMAFLLSYSSKLGCPCPVCARSGLQDPSGMHCRRGEANSLSVQSKEPRRREDSLDETRKFTDSGSSENIVADAAGCWLDALRTETDSCESVSREYLLSPPDVGSRGAEPPWFGEEAGESREEAEKSERASGYVYSAQDGEAVWVDDSHNVRFFHPLLGFNCRLSSVALLPRSALAKTGLSPGFFHGETQVPRGGVSGVRTPCPAEGTPKPGCGEGVRNDTGKKGGEGAKKNQERGGSSRSFRPVKTDRGRQNSDAISSSAAAFSWPEEDHSLTDEAYARRMLSSSACLGERTMEVKRETSGLLFDQEKEEQRESACSVDGVSLNSEQLLFFREIQRRLLMHAKTPATSPFLPHDLVTDPRGVEAEAREAGEAAHAAKENKRAVGNGGGETVETGGDSQKLEREGKRGRFEDSHREEQEIAALGKPQKREAMFLQQVEYLSSSLVFLSPGGSAEEPQRRHQGHPPARLLWGDSLSLVDLFRAFFRFYTLQFNSFQNIVDIRRAPLLPLAKTTYFSVPLPGAPDLPWLKGVGSRAKKGKKQNAADRSEHEEANGDSQQPAASVQEPETETAAVLAAAQVWGSAPARGCRRRVQEREEEGRRKAEQEREHADCCEREQEREEGAFGKEEEEGEQEEEEEGEAGLDEGGGLGSQGPHPRSVDWLYRRRLFAIQDPFEAHRTLGTYHSGSELVAYELLRATAITSSEGWTLALPLPLCGVSPSKGPAGRSVAPRGVLPPPLFEAFRVSEAADVRKGEPQQSPNHPAAVKGPEGEIRRQVDANKGDSHGLKEQAREAPGTAAADRGAEPLPSFSTPSPSYGPHPAKEDKQTLTPHQRRQEVRRMRFAERSRPQLPWVSHPPAATLLRAEEQGDLAWRLISKRLVRAYRRVHVRYQTEESRVTGEQRDEEHESHETEEASLVMGAQGETGREGGNRRGKTLRKTESETECWRTQGFAPLSLTPDEISQMTQRSREGDRSKKGEGKQQRPARAERDRGSSFPWQGPAPHFQESANRRVLAAHAVAVDPWRRRNSSQFNAPQGPTQNQPVSAISSLSSLASQRPEGDRARAGARAPGSYVSLQTQLAEESRQRRPRPWLAVQAWQEAEARRAIVHEDTDYRCGGRGANNISPNHMPLSTEAHATGHTRPFGPNKRLPVYRQRELQTDTVPRHV
ncbi:polynucleotide adenylyltransferase, partial [Toxoplasma gondii MAS]